ncbi:BtpA/SgcQ family protein [Thermomicrobium sp. 4228-Ro]|uniref:BtpA/SgcQ family protein n=1 Tax=Thermomicrobium sp. 4228-Ro TaxID=2993937 RepID=UPI002248CCBB|nr:BtpA/SgcQ family protein [Thermomicrobium sp. 4228-Ro]MCX2727537.1 BtpA/SgcQ family protein [Thermomicrobium sp. 4228-Ro]
MRTERTHRFLLAGVIHLLPLPGSPRARAFAEVRERALRDAEAYARGGMDMLLVENYGDAPFPKERVAPHVIAGMALIVDAVKRATGLPVGVNVLRNDAQAALGIAAMAGAQFIRVNVHVGAMLTDQGIIEGRADETLRYRKLLETPVEIWADVLVKHAAPLASLSLEDAARDTVQRGLADALIVTGQITGQPPNTADVARLRAAFPSVRLFLGSGVTADNVGSYLACADGAIVGTWTKVGGRTENPVDEQRVRQLVQAIGRS